MSCIENKVLKLLIVKLVLLQITEELSGKPFKLASDDHTLPVCWKGRKPFKSVRDVKKYFKSLALVFSDSGRRKTQFELPPEAYLMISVLNPLLSFHFGLLIQVSIALWGVNNAKEYIYGFNFQAKGNVCLGILNGTEVGLGNVNLIGGKECFYSIKSLVLPKEMFS